MGTGDTADARPDPQGLINRCKAAPRFGVNAKALLLASLAEDSDVANDVSGTRKGGVKAKDGNSKGDECGIPLPPLPEVKKEEILKALPAKLRPAVAYTANARVPRGIRQAYIDTFFCQYLRVVAQYLQMDRGALLKAVGHDEELVKAASAAALAEEGALWSKHKTKQVYLNFANRIKCGITSIDRATLRRLVSKHAGGPGQTAALQLLQAAWSSGKHNPGAAAAEGPSSSKTVADGCGSAPQRPLREQDISELFGDDDDEDDDDDDRATAAGDVPGGQDKGEAPFAGADGGPAEGLRGGPPAGRPEAAPEAQGDCEADVSSSAAAAQEDGEPGPPPSPVAEAQLADALGVSAEPCGESPLGADAGTPHRQASLEGSSGRAAALSRDQLPGAPADEAEPPKAADSSCSPPEGRKRQRRWGPAVVDAAAPPPPPGPPPGPPPPLPPPSEEPEATLKAAALALVKEVLHPMWTSGLLSRELYKAVTKRCVDKVCRRHNGVSSPDCLKSERSQIQQLVTSYIRFFRESSHANPPEAAP